MNRAFLHGDRCSIKQHVVESSCSAHSQRIAMSATCSTSGRDASITCRYTTAPRAPHVVRRRQPHWLQHGLFGQRVTRTRAKRHIPTAIPNEHVEQLDLLEATPQWIERLTDTQRAVLAKQWGYTHVGTALPNGINPEVLSSLLSNDAELGTVYKFEAIKGFVAPLAWMAAGYFVLWYQRSIIPAWQLLACWALIGTGYAGLFNLAHECSREALLPDNPATQHLLGSLIMAPSLYAYEVWRARVYNHLFFLNALGNDTSAWHPLTVEQLAASGPLQLLGHWLVATTPLKLLASIGDWLKGWKQQGLKLEAVEDVNTPQDIASSCWWPLGFAVVAFTAMIKIGGVSGWVQCWLGPWLVFHLWLSTLTLLQHTAPHIPFRSMETDHDLAQAIVSGTVHVRLPRWLEQLVNCPNYHMPQHVDPGMPFYHAERAYGVLHEKLWPYMTQATLNPKLITNLITQWQVYDTASETYITFQQAFKRAAVLRQQLLARAAAEREAQEAAGAAAEQAQQQQQQQQQQVQPQGTAAASAKAGWRDASRVMQELGINAAAQ